jgi:dephospho-CoA kinase
VERIFGITGGAGMGKSTVGALLSHRGVAIIDTDQIARHIVEPGQPALSEIVERFGASILRPDHTLDRQALAQRVFPDAQSRADLEGILHPRIRAIWNAEVQRWRTGSARAAGNGRSGEPSVKAPPRFGAVLIPLLFETDSQSCFDATICVACSTATQTQRLTDRGWSAQQIQQRNEAQWPIEKKIAQSTYVVWTDTSLDSVGAQLDKILERPGARVDLVPST